MELISTSRREKQPMALAYGAYLIDGGKRLRCGLLFVQRGNTRRSLTFRCPDTKQKIRVRLPALAINAKAHCRFSRLELEVVST